MSQEKKATFWKVHIIALTGLAAALFLFQIFKVYSVKLNDTDFRYVWLAGKLWRAHLDPYSSLFTTESAYVFGIGKELSVWVYPFQWIWLAAPLSFFSPSGALLVWRCASFALIAAATFIVSRLLMLLHLELTPTWAVAYIAYVMAFNPLGATLQLAQPVIIPAFGFVLLLYGSAKNSSLIKIASILMLALKPQFGLPILLMFVWVKGNMQLYVVAALTTIAVAIPALLMSGTENQIVGIVQNIVGGYDRVGVNSPIAMIGLPNIVALITHFNMPLSVGFLIASCFSLLVGLLLHRATRLTAEHRLIYMSAFAALSVSAIVGVHPSDLIVLLVALPLMASQNTVSRVIGLVGYALLCRFENVAKILAAAGVATGITLATLAVFLISAGWMIDLFVRLRRSHAVSGQPTAS